MRNFLGYLVDLLCAPLLPSLLKLIWLGRLMKRLVWERSSRHVRTLEGTRGSCRGGWLAVWRKLWLRIAAEIVDLQPLDSRLDWFYLEEVFWLRELWLIILILIILKLSYHIHNFSTILGRRLWGLSSHSNVFEFDLEWRLGMNRFDVTADRQFWASLIKWP